LFGTNRENSQKKNRNFWGFVQIRIKYFYTNPLSIRSGGRASIIKIVNLEKRGFKR